MQFRDVRDYEGLYKVNDQAQVWGIKKKQSLIWLFGMQIHLGKKLQILTWRFGKRT